MKKSAAFSNYGKNRAPQSSTNSFLLLKAFKLLSLWLLQSDNFQNREGKCYNWFKRTIVLQYILVVVQLLRLWFGPNGPK